MRRIYGVGLLIPMMLSGCDKKDTVTTNNAANSGNSATTPASLPNEKADAAKLAEMVAVQKRVIVALQKAHATLPDFIKALKKPKPSQSQFSVKCGVADEGKTRHVWLDDVTFDGKKFHGKLGNRVMDKNAKPGSRVDVMPDGVSDWMYIENGKLIGGYTLRAMRDSLSPQEKKDFDKTLPFKVD